MVSWKRGQVHAVLGEKLTDALHFEIPRLTLRQLQVSRIPQKARAVIGMRRSGKTWFLFQQMLERMALGVPRDRLMYFNFEDERLGDQSVDQLSWLLEEYYRRVPQARDSHRVTFLLDEVQLVSGWESFVRRVLDSEQMDFILSGSSARLLSREVATTLRGRAAETTVYPFGFGEFLSHHSVEPVRDAKTASKAQRSQLESWFLRYLYEGGFPEAQGLGVRERIELLQGYVDVVTLRDILERHKISNLLVVRALVRNLLANPAGRFSVHRFYNDLRSQGVAVSKDLLHQLMTHLEDAFLIHSVPMATSSERQRQSNPRKIYPIDPGLAVAYNRTGKANRGALLESIVAVELARRGWQFGYVTTPSGYEVDFEAWDWQKNRWLIQVCTDFELVERELRALREAQRPDDRLLVLSLTEEFFTAGVAVTPTWKWLLEGDPSI